MMKPNFTDMDDSELIRYFRDDKYCERAFTEFYARYSKKVYSYCLRIIGDRDDTNDVFQNVFSKFYTTVRKMEKLDNPKGYLFRIAHNMTLNSIRKFIQYDEYNDEISTSNLSENDYERKEMTEIVRDALQKLPEKYREPLVMKQYSGMKIKEIADVIGETEGNTKTLLTRAKEKVKKILEPYLDGKI